MKEKIPAGVEEAKAPEDSGTEASKTPEKTEREIREQTFPPLNLLELLQRSEENSKRARVYEYRAGSGWFTLEDGTWESCPPPP